MAAKDLYHQSVINALEKDGWTIRRDPFAITYLNRTVFVDLAIDGLSFVAEKHQSKIAIEIKSFLSNSPVKDLQEAIGQYLMYELVLYETDPDCELWLAIPFATYEEFFQEEFTNFILGKIPMNLVIFDQQSATIVKWIRPTHTGTQSSS
jgi:hypothetical protein